MDNNMHRNAYRRRKKRTNPLAVALLIVLIIIALFGIILAVSGYRYINADGIRFSGKIRDNQPVSGTVRYENGVSGKLTVDPATLIGTVYYDNGDVYYGNFKGIKRDGKGTMTYAEQNIIYEGDFADDMATGKAKITSGTKVVYEGDVVNGKKHGFGTFYFDNGSYYYGNFENDRRNGSGAAFLADGSYYYGTFADDLKSGTGEVSVKLPDGSIYTGKCRYVYANGDEYVGDFANDLMSGYGVYTYATGEKYEGDFANNTMNGTGTYTFSAGRDPYTGVFIDGKLAPEDEAAMSAAAEDAADGIQTAA